MSRKKRMSSEGILSAVVMGITFASATSSHAGQSHPLVIYGADNRLEIHQEPDVSKRELARSVIAVLPSAALQSKDPGNALVTGEKFGQMFNLCPKERFVDQLAPAYCTGFLVADNIMVTAGHCVQEADFCKDARFIFDFSIDNAARDPNAIKSMDVYSCRRVVYDQIDAQGADFALVELDRPVVGRTPLRLANQAPKVGDSVFVIGHPAGLPAKIAGDAQVRKNTAGFFTANLDTYGGNSGSPVFIEGTNEVAGVLVRGDQDFMRHRRGTCNVSVRCRNELCRGEDVTNVEIVAEKLLDVLTTPNTPIARSK